MGCGTSSEASEPSRKHSHDDSYHDRHDDSRHHRHNDSRHHGHNDSRHHGHDDNNAKKEDESHYLPPHDPTPPPREPTPPPPREPTPPPPREPTPPPPREPTPPPPREPTPPPPREPTPPPPREPTPPPPREPTPPPPREPTKTPVEPTPPPESEHGGEAAAGEYVENDIGIKEAYHEFVDEPDPVDRDFSEEPTETPFVDYDFPAEVAIKGERVEWKRPGEIRDNPVLFSDGTTRYDIGQGSAGTCWFLSTVAMLADHPEIFRRVVPQDAWNQEGGYFRCCFWRFGQWEDVYIDDFLPVVHGDMLWGAKSKDDPNEMWPALLEKAFARFHGNYNSVYGGQSGDAFLALTGGCSEYIDFDKALEADAAGSEMKKALKLHTRLQNACKTDAILTTEVPEEYNDHLGLVGGHAYSLVDARTVTNKHGKDVYLVRIRNPWGHTEWKGPWSDGSKEWSTIDAGCVPQAEKDDGEFWMSLETFIKYFSGLTICSMKPDFDMDGNSDSLDHCTTLFGRWLGETAAGFQNRLDSPRYHFNVSTKCADESGLCPLVVQICQRLKHRQANKFSIRVDLYKVLEEQDTEEGPLAVVMLLGDVTNVYKCERQMSNRYKVEPGSYIAVPSTIEAGQEKEFLVRVFSSAPITDVREFDRDYSLMATDEDENEEYDFSQTLISAWRPGSNAGGQVSHNTFHTNPQIEFEIPDGQHSVNFTLLKPHNEATHAPIGFQVFPMDNTCTFGHDHQDYLYNHYESGPKSTSGGKGAFILGNSAECTYHLQPGRYFILLHMDQPSDESRFALIVKSDIQLNLVKHNTP